MRFGALLRAGLAPARRLAAAIAIFPDAEVRLGPAGRAVGFTGLVLGSDFAAGRLGTGVTPDEALRARFAPRLVSRFLTRVVAAARATRFPVPSSGSAEAGSVS